MNNPNKDKPNFRKKLGLEERLYQTGPRTAAAISPIILGMNESIMLLTDEGGRKTKPGLLPTLEESGIKDFSEDLMQVADNIVLAQQKIEAWKQQVDLMLIVEPDMPDEQKPKAEKTGDGRLFLPQNLGNAVVSQTVSTLSDAATFFSNEIFPFRSRITETPDTKLGQIQGDILLRIDLMPELDPRRENLLTTAAKLGNGLSQTHIDIMELYKIVVNNFGRPDKPDFGQLGR
jgi:hypothetical protein